MRHLLALALLDVTSTGIAADKDDAAAKEKEDGFARLCDGKSLDGWTAQDPSAAGTFTVDDGAILTHGGFQHLFYSGPEHGAKWKNFELRAEFKMAPSSNSGIFF